MEYFEVKYKDYKARMNLSLLKSNGKEDNLEELKEVYIELYKTFEKMENTDNPITLFNLNKHITELEFKMQELWGFPINEDYHRYWFQCPKCSCGKIDNNEAIETKFRYINPACIIHGTKTYNLLKREDKIKRILK